MRFLCLSLALVVLAACGDDNAQSPPVANAEPAVQESRLSFTSEQGRSARVVMANARDIARFSDEGGNLSVTFQDFIFNADSQTRYRLIRSIADADVILTGRPRTIQFYRTDGKLIGQADPRNGVRLLD